MPADGRPTAQHPVLVTVRDHQPPRFGIVHVDQETQVRTPKTSAPWLRDLQQQRCG